MAALHVHFVSLLHHSESTASTSRSIPSEVSLSQFQRGLGFISASSLFVERVFRVMFDTDGSGKLDFPKFVHGIHRLSSSETHDNKVKYSYAMHNIAGGDGISRADLTRMLTSCLHESEVAVPAADVDAIVSKTFATFDADGDDRISFDEYIEMVKHDKEVLAPLTLDVPELILAAKADADAGVAAGAAAATA